MRPLLAIQCITYNQEPYIREALEGFVKQNTTFPFVAIVHDDASTDGTAKIIQEYAVRYPDIIKPIYETENQYSKRDGSLTRIMNDATNATGAKYVAFCEGDDYWTDPLKLQRQVDFLEEHSDFGLCYTAIKQYSQTQNKVIGVWGGNSETLERLLRFNTIPTMSVVARGSLYRSYYSEIIPYKHGWKMGDYPLWLYLSQKSKVKFINHVTGVYRVLDNSASHSTSPETQSLFAKSVLEIQKYYLAKYLPLRLDLLNQAEMGYIKTLMRIRVEYGYNPIIESEYVVAVERLNVAKLFKLGLKNIIRNPLLRGGLKVYYKMRYS